MDGEDVVMDGEDVVMEDATKAQQGMDASARLLDAHKILYESNGSSQFPSARHSTIHQVAATLSRSDVNPLAVYRAAACLRECELKEIVQFLVFAGPTAVPSALRLLNVMRGLPGNWELTMELLEQQNPEELGHLEHRVMTLIALLGGKKAYHLLGWSRVIHRALQDGYEESRLTMHMVLEKKWDGPIESVYRISDWKNESQYAQNPTIWREMQWAAYSRALSAQASVCDDSVTTQGDASRTALQDAWPCFELLPNEFGPVALHYTRVVGILLRRRAVGTSDSAPGTDIPVSSCGEKHVDVLERDAFVVTPSHRGVIRVLAGAVCYGVPVVLEGGSGCGKTSLLSLLGRETLYKKPLHESEVPGVTFIQMDSTMSDSDGDTFDSLVGSIVPLPEGGGFRWRPGPIGLAIEKGEWLVFENLGKMSVRSSTAIPIIAQLAALRPGDAMSAPGRGQPLRVGKGFRCIGTRTTSDFEKDDRWEPPGGWAIWDRVSVPALSEGEKVDMLRGRYPLVKDCVLRVVRAVESVSEFVRTIRGPLSRDSTLREAVRICTRLNALRAERTELLTAENSLLETIDVLAAWCPVQEQRRALLEILATCWSLPADVARDLVLHHRPSFSWEDAILRIGRASMATIADKKVNHLNRLTLTGYTLRLLERVLRCLQVDEHVLLTGEAGSGKTAVIQEVATFLRKKLVVVNLSRQSELGDLIGAFRPVELAAAVPLLAKKFEEAFCITMSRKKNGRFLDALQRASRCAEDHPRAVRLMQGAAEAVPASAKNADANRAEKWHDIREELAKVSRSFVPSTNVVHAESSDGVADGIRDAGERPRKKRKGDLLSPTISQKTLSDGPKKRTRSKRRVDFRFAEGVLAQAMREGHWILLDEINLAPAELLERLVSVVDRGQVLLPNETGDHLTKSDGFRLFAAMNPPTDVGKRPLPGVLRARFSEFHCGDMLDKDDIVLMALHRLYGLRGSLEDTTDQLFQEKTVAHDIASFYLKCSSLGREGRIEEVTGKPVRFSLRTLSRMLDFASGFSRYMKRGESGMRRALFEGAILAFSTPLLAASRALVSEVALTTLLQRNSKNSRIEAISAALTVPSNMKEDVKFIEGFPIATTPKGLQHLHNKEVPFVVSPAVRKTLQDVCRALALGTCRVPIVLQGPTAAGKTSLVTYLAAITGNSLVRINNHEHTDLSEYIGGYVATPNGSLVFHEGPLVQAARTGSWVLLDELNLAPPEVLESLNRLLDDNREILLPETGEVVRAATGFTVFATQNPPGLYGGRKELSRAFRSRFVEIQVSDLPDQDLLTILEQRCHIPPSFAKKMITVMRELQLRRRTTSLFSGRDGFVTARDLFRWASRGPRSKEELAVHGFLLLGERSRRPAEKEIVRTILIQVIGVDEDVLDDAILFSFDELPTGSSPSQDCLDFSLQKLALTREVLVRALRTERIVPTTHMRRMITLLIHGIANDEPVLLVGSTGGGKTSCCSVICRALATKLLTVNCHQHTEASDILGSFRPNRSGDADGPLFEWVDGPLVQAMKRGSVVLIDEINMAEDAVIERLNSVLELERTILLSEKGAIASPKGSGDELALVSEVITADVRFRILATMNPGGDYGKKELSPALRNRFTEIWVPTPSSLEEFSPIVQTSLSVNDAVVRNGEMQLAGKALCDFLEWSLAKSTTQATATKQKSALTRYGVVEPRILFSVRDVSTWCDFIAEAVRNSGINPLLALVHGARLVFLDGLSVGSTGTKDNELELQIWKQLISLVPQDLRDEAEAAKFWDVRGIAPDESDDMKCALKLKFGLFGIPRNLASDSHGQSSQRSAYSFHAPCTARNTARLARAMAVGLRPILLEGPPGCGKSSLVTALASAAGFSFVRINLSDSTEMSDLVGSESPGELPGTFAFRAGPLLTALQNGSWLLLDELNLASQSVLEGLNSVLDHRRSLFVPELSREVQAHSLFRVFGAQNPAFEGGGRRGLPKSFLNRFTRVHMEAPSREDILSIISSLHPLVEAEIAASVVDTLHGVKEVLKDGGHAVDMASFGLRDALRWCDLFTAVRSNQESLQEFSCLNSSSDRYYLGLCFDVVILQGLKEGREREIAEHSFKSAFGFEWRSVHSLPSVMSSGQRLLRIGHSVLSGNDFFSFGTLGPCSSLLLPSQLRELQALSFAVNAGWPVVVCSNSSRACAEDGVRLVHTLARLCGKSVKSIHGGSLADCDEFVGGYCQQDVIHVMQMILTVSEDITQRCIHLLVGTQLRTSVDDGLDLLNSVQVYDKQLRSIVDLVSSNNCVAEETITDFLQTSETLSWHMQSLGGRDACLDCYLRSLQQLQLKLKTLRCSLLDGSFASFEWKKSNFVEAIEKGEWILLRDADSCPPAILDRLNPILERPAVAIVDGIAAKSSAQVAPVVLAEAPANEDGSPVLMKPHPDFRIFFLFSSHGTSTMHNGLSRALLDRSLKISMSARDDCMNSLAVDLGYVSEGKAVDYVGSMERLHVSLEMTSPKKRFQVAIGSASVEHTQSEEVVRHRSSLESHCSSAAIPRTHEADFALNPRHQLIERDLTALNVVETARSEMFCSHDTFALSEGLLKSSSIHGITLDATEDLVRAFLLYPVAEGLILASQSYQDLLIRCRALRNRAELSTCSSAKRSYTEVAQIAEQWQAVSVSDMDQTVVGRGDTAGLPIDPMYAGDTSSVFLVLRQGSEEYRIMSKGARRFRIGILALQAFRSSWKRASEAPIRSGGIDETAFARAKLSHAVGAAAMNHMSGDCQIELIAYDVLARIAGVAEKVCSSLNHGNELTIPEERRVIKLLVSARELCDLMATAVTADFAEMHCRVVDIVESAKEINRTAAANCYGLSDVLSMECLEELHVLEKVSARRRLMLMPRTENGQKAELQMLTVLPYYTKGLLSFREVDGFVKGLVSLSAENVEEDRDVLKVLGKVTAALSTTRASAKIAPTRLQYWTQTALLRAANLFREAMILLQGPEMVKRLHKGSSHIAKAVSDSLFSVKCVPSVRLSSVAALQRLHWLLENVDEFSEVELLQPAWRELQTTMMSSLLTETSAVSVLGIASGELLRETHFSERGLSSSLMMFAQDSSQYPFWGLVSARREATSAMAWVITGSHVVHETFEHSRELLIASLRSVMSYVRILPVQKVDLLQSEGEIEVLDLLLQQTQLKMTKFERHADMWELCRLQADAIVNVRTAVSRINSDENLETTQLLKHARGQMSRSGVAWISLGLLRLRSYYVLMKGKNGIDPSQLARATAALNFKRSIRARCGIAAYSLLRRHRLGGDLVSHSTPLCRLEEEQKECMDLFSTAERQYVFRPEDRPSFASLSATVDTVNAVITDKVIRSELVSRLVSSNAHHENSTQSIEEALDLYHSCVATAEKLELAGTLSHFRDLTADLVLGLREVQYGLATCIRYSKLLRLVTDRATAKKIHAFCDITLFPRAAFQSTMTVSDALRICGAAGLSWPVLMSCTEYLIDSELQGIVRNDTDVSRALSYIVSLWKTSSLSQEEEDKKRNSLHILREAGKREEVPGYGFVEDLERDDEQDFIHTFNPIKDEVEDALLGLNRATNECDDEGQMEMDNRPAPETILDCEAFWRIHVKAFPGQENVQLLTGELSARCSVVQSLSKHLYSMSEGFHPVVDQVSDPWDIFSAVEIVQRFEPAKTTESMTVSMVESSHRTSSIDFYRASNPDELVHGSKALRNLHKTVGQIQKEFFADTGDHPVLAEISLAIESVANTCNLSTPLSSVVVGVENVLRKADEWRRLFATSATRMDEDVLALSRVAARWRRLERASWKLLLQNRIKSVEGRAGKWFFYLYDAVIHEASSAAQLRNESARQSIIAVVDQFLRSSPSGEFARRLEMILSLGTHVLSLSKHDRPLWTPLGLSLRGIGRYYSLFAPLVSHGLSKATGVIEAKLEEFSKLLSWNPDPDIGSSQKMSKEREKHLEYYRLKAAAERTKRKLHKLCLEMDSVLRIPVYDHLTKEIQKIGFETLACDDDIVDVKNLGDRKNVQNGKKSVGKTISISVDELIRELSSSCGLRSNGRRHSGSVESERKLLSRLTSLESRLVHFGQLLKDSVSSGCDAAVSFCRDTRFTVRSRAIQLRQSTNVGVQPKKRALVDLMKGLRSVGLSPFENQVFTASKEPLFWLSSPDPSQNSSYNKISNELFLVGVQQLRRLKELSDSRIRSPDITGDEAQKSRSFCAHLFDMAYSQRTTLSDLLTDVAYINEACSQLQGRTEEVVLCNDRRRNATSCAHLLGIINGLKKICLDLEVTAAAVRFAQETSNNVQDLNSHDLSGTLIQRQLPTTRALLLQLSVIFDTGIDAIRAGLQSEEFLRLEVGSRQATRTYASTTGHGQILKTLQSVKSVIDAQLLKALALSSNNVGVQVLAPTANYLRVSVKGLVTELPSEPIDTAMVPKDLVRRIEDLCETLVEKTLIGTQNVLLWSKVPIESGEGNENTNVNGCDRGNPGEPLRIPNLLRNAHNDVITFPSRSNIGQLALILKQLMSAQESFMGVGRCEGQTNDSLRRILGVQQSVGRFIGTYIDTMIFPCLSKIGLMHCHSLAFLRTVSSVFVGVCSEGFCRPANEPQEPDNGDVVAENAGTGFGSVGDGDIGTAQDVSEEIEDEEQLLGLQNDIPEREGDKQQSHSEPEKGFEMTTDFDGELEDLDRPEDESRDEETEGDDKGLSAEVGEGKDVVDEKLWDQGDGDPPKPDGTGEEDMSTAAGEDKHTDLTAKRTDGFAEKEKQSKTTPENEDTEEPVDELEGQEQKERADDTESNEHDSLQKPKPKVGDIGMPDSESLSDGKPSCEEPGEEEARQTGQDQMERTNELAPEKAEDEDDGSALANEDGEGDDDDVPMEGTGTGDDSIKKGTDGKRDEDNGLPDANSDCEMESLSLDGTEVQPDDQGDDVFQQENDVFGSSELGDEANDLLSGLIEEPNRIASQADSIQHSDTEEETTPIPKIPRSEAGRVAQTAARTDSGTMTTTQQASTIERSGNASSAFPAPAGSSLNAGIESNTVDSGTGAGVQEGSENAGPDQGNADTLRRRDDIGESTNINDVQAPDPNPLRATLGEDIISKWSKYLKVIEQERDAADQRKSADVQEDEGVWEFGEEGGDDPAEKVALGAATEEQHRALPDQDQEDNHGEEMAEDNAEATKQKHKTSSETCTDAAIQPQPAPERKSHELMPPENRTADATEVDEGNNETQLHPARIAAERLRQDRSQSDLADPEIAAVGRSARSEDANGGDNGPEDEMDAGDDLEVEAVSGDVRSWNVGNLGDEEATRLWRKLNQLSSTGASTLCEQLRLVLEPTVVSRLAGGYRTGKRLNIRKVIEFVASDFRRDRIWLRRVRPDKRSYDVLLAIDDSESMSESEAGQMALESLALVTSALARLEIGRLAVASFGAVTRMVRDFDEPLPLSDVRGGQLLQHFCFSQKETDISKLLQFIQTAMVDVEGSGDLDQIKLVFVISDGRLSGREEIKKRLRYLRDANVLVAFVIVDQIGESETSIYDVRRVEYGANGKIQVLPYMQDFPIDFYAVVQDVRLLPTVLADALRQWVEITSAAV